MILVKNDTKFWNWWSVAKARRVLAFTVRDKVLKRRVAFRLIWWSGERTLMPSLVRPE